MQIKYSVNFKTRLKNIQLFIANDKLSASKKFIRNLKIQCENLTEMPKKYRKSHYFDDENIRDMTYYGYTIIYEISDKTIEIQDIFNQNLPL